MPLRGGDVLINQTSITDEQFGLEDSQFLVQPGSAPGIGSRAAVIKQIIDRAIVGHQFLELPIHDPDKARPTGRIVLRSARVAGIGPVGHGVV